MAEMGEPGDGGESVVKSVPNSSVSNGLYSDDEKLVYCYREAAQSARAPIEGQRGS